jgi:hypothetical protein
MLVLLKAAEMVVPMVVLMVAVKAELWGFVLAVMMEERKVYTAVCSLVSMLVLLPHT